jgi:hypothetical protein
MTSFSHSAAANQYQGSKPPSPVDNSSNSQDPTPRPLYAQWWGEGGENDGVTPTASSFVREDGSQDAGEFVSLMDSEPTLMPSMPSVSTNGKHSNYAGFDDEDDLGFGNSKKPKQTDAEDEPSSEAERSHTAKPAPSPAQPANSQKPNQAEQAAPGKHSNTYPRVLLLMIHIHSCQGLVLLDEKRQLYPEAGSCQTRTREFILL